MESITSLVKTFLNKNQTVKWVISQAASTMDFLRGTLYPCITKEEFISDIKYAVENNVGYAAGKIGASQQHLLYYEILKNKTNNISKIKQFEKNLIFHAYNQIGVFPVDVQFYLEYGKFYIEHLRNIDCLGVFHYKWEMEIVKYYQLQSKLIHFVYQEPDRSIPCNDNKCYLQYFRDQKILLIAPFANLLQQRANQEIFESVWLKTGKKWFYPKSVDALEFPYGFLKETHDKYTTAIDLYKDITAEIEKRDFDVALISAAGLAIPIASHIKNMGKVGIDLGGHQQVLFGVIGKRWREQKYWQKNYFNEHWINMPTSYKPGRKDVCDQGAYW